VHVASFASKASPGADKLRGGYYTPDIVAQFVADWVAEAGPRLLEPAAGDGAILAPLAKHGRVVSAVELLEEEAEKATRRSGVEVVVGDFFRWFDPWHHGTFDGAAGNPPYIRFGHWEEKFRAPAFALMQSQGLKPTRLTNAWVPFIVGSIMAVRHGGRVGLVLPAELLQVGYAAPVRSYLVDNCSAITVVSFKRLLFAGIQQEVVLLLAERGVGPAAIRTIEVEDAFSLASVTPAGPAARAHLHESEKWTKYYLDAESIEMVRTVRSDGRLSPFGRWAEVDVGVVSGRNSFFCMTAEESAARHLDHVTVPLVSRSAHVPGLTFTPQDLSALDDSGARTRLLAIPPDTKINSDPNLASYLSEGELEGVPEGYKCRIRRNWWQVPTPWIPDGFMLRQISTHPRIVANSAGATSTDTVHRFRVHSESAADVLAVAAYNSATFALSEIIGRSYGGGILELEPSEAEELPVPNPALVPDGLPDKVDALAREGRIEEALNLVDQLVLVDGAGFDPAELVAMRSIWTRLRDRRVSRR
jgi:adenine-specific DNA methylase